MPRAYPHSHVCYGKVVGFNLAKRANEPTYFVYFKSIDGKRLERDTNHTAKTRADEVARALIEKEYQPRGIPADKTTWDDAIVKLKSQAKADGIRDTTIGYYEKLIRLIRAQYGATDGPIDISPSMANTWKTTYSSTKTRRGKVPSSHTMFNLLRGMSALWQTWFVDKLSICPGNPWQDVEPPKTDKLEIIPIEDEQLTLFLQWIDKKYSGWNLPRLFLEVKAVTGCRLMDLCGLESPQLADGRLTFRADQTKGRKARSITLPSSLFTELDAIKGKKYLWENYPQGLRDSVKKMGCPTHRIKPDFKASRLYHWIETLFIDYGDEFPDRPKIHSHQLRKRAFTAAWEEGIDPRKAAIAIGCNVDTIMKHYVKLDEQDITDEVMGQLAKRLSNKKTNEQK